MQVGNVFAWLSNHSQFTYDYIFCRGLCLVFPSHIHDRHFRARDFPCRFAVGGGIGFLFLFVGVQEKISEGGHNSSL